MSQNESPVVLDGLTDSERGLGSRLRALLRTTLGPLAALLVIWLAFVVADRLRPNGGAFLGWKSHQAMAAHTARVAVPALGMTIIIIAGGIDLSMGAAAALAATTMAWSLLKGYGPMESLGVALATGCIAGAINGALIGALRIVPFIITLGTMMIFQGCGRWLAGDTPIRPDSSTVAWIGSFQAPFVEPRWWLFAPGVWVMLAIAAIVALVLRYSVFGRHVFALGSSEATARLCGINVPATRIAVYSLGGLLAGVAGIYQFSTLSQGDPMAGIGDELHYIAAVVVGGGSLSGGRGSPLGTLCGAAIMVVIENGCGMMGVRDLYQDILVGLIIIAAVAIDQLRTRRG